MSQNHGNRKPMRAGLAAAAACLLAACLEDSPRIDPENVYDANLAVRDAHFEGLDSVRILLVDTRDTTRKILIYSGKPDASASIPPYHAEEGRTFYFLLEGFAAGRGLCRLETLGPGMARVNHDTCRANPMSTVVGLQDTFLEVADYPRNPILRLYRKGSAPDTLGVTLISSVSWLQPVDPRLILADLILKGSVELKINWDSVPPGQADATIRVRADDILQGEARVAIRGTLARASLLGGDTILLDPGVTQWSGTLILPDFPPGTAWHLFGPTFPTRPDEFIGLRDFDLNSRVGPPGARRKYTLLFNLNPYTKAQAGKVARLIALDASRDNILDSIHFVFAPPFSINGRYAEASAAPKAGTEILLDGGRARTRTDTAGFFRFLGADPGPHLVTVNLPDRFTPAQTLVTDAEGWTAMVYPRVGKRLAFKRVEIGTSGAGLGPVGVFEDMLAMVVWTFKDGHVLLKASRFSDRVESRVPLEFPGFGEETADNLPQAMAGVPGLLYLAYPGTRRLGILPLWEGATNPRLLDLPFAPLALHLTTHHLAVAGVDSAGGLVLWAFSGDESAPIQAFPLGVAWDPDAGKEGGSGIRILSLPLTGTGLDSADVPFYQVFVPGKGQSPGKLVRLRPYPGAPPARSVDIEGSATEFQDGLMAFESPMRRGMFHFDADLAGRDSIPFAGPVRDFVNLGKMSSGLEHIAVLDGKGMLRFLESATGVERGAVPLPPGAVRDLFFRPNPSLLVLVTDSGVWTLEF